MDDRTVRYYDQHAAEVAAGYRSTGATIRARFREAFPDAGARILDVGAGSGRDLDALIEQGYDATGIEPAACLRAEAERHYPRLRGRIHAGAMPFPEGSVPGQSFDGVLCCAALMHVPAEELFASAFSLRELLRPGGRLFLSTPATRPGLDAGQRDGGGRLFTDLQPGAVRLLFERIGFTLVRQWDEDDGAMRPGLRWNSFIFERRSAGDALPLERMETVLSRDRKTATYKLALLRALAEISTREHNHVQWASRERVLVPLRLVAQKWVGYYWPIVASPDFVPQNNGETAGSSKPIAFRRQLARLADDYRDLGGRSRFWVDLHADTLRDEAASLYRETVTKVVQTIKQGPMTHTSGNIFEHVRQRGTSFVSVGADFWRELTMLGHWIEPAIILRWAEETERMSKGRVKTGAALDLLTVPLEQARNTRDAHDIYRRVAEKHCVWTGTGLGARYDIDHLLPFSLWRNNELWNLMPCHPSINNAKRDRLPERGLLYRRRDTIIGYWRVGRSAAEQRFDSELGGFIHPHSMAPNWETAAFDRLLQSVEETAYRRGWRRWHP